MNSELFISYANYQFNESPEYLNYFLEEVEAFNRDVYFQIANYSEEELLQTLNNKNSISFEAISDYAEIAVDQFEDPQIFEIFKTVSTLFKQDSEASDLLVTTTRYKAELSAGNICSSMEGNINCMALDGVFYSRYGEQGCPECVFNQSWERHLINQKNGACINCHQAYLRETLDRIIDGENLYDITGIHCLIEAMNKVVTKQVFVRKKGTLEEYSWIKNHFLTGRYDSEPQQFSTFLIGCLGFSLISFLSKFAKNVLKIKKCKICNNYFIASKADSRIKKCNTCSGKLTKEENRKKKQQERINKKEQKRRNKIRAYRKKLQQLYSEQEIKDLIKNGNFNKIVEDAINKGLN